MALLPRSYSGTLPDKVHLRFHHLYAVASGGRGSYFVFGVVSDFALCLCQIQTSGLSPVFDKSASESKISVIR